MPGIGPDYSQLFGQVMPYSEYGQTGIDPGYTGLAQSLGYQPDPMAPYGSEGMAQMRFLATLKNLIDQEMGGPGGRAAQISGGNPSAGLPFAARQYVQLAQGLMNSNQGHELLPGSQRAMFQNGYSFDPINANPSDPNAVMQLYAAARQSNQMPGQGQAPTLPGSPAQGGQLTPPNQQAPSSTGGQLNRGMDSSQVTGLPGDAAMNPALSGGAQSALPPPPNGGAPVQGASNQSNLASALQAQDIGGAAQGPNIGTTPEMARLQAAYPGVPMQLIQMVQSGQLPSWVLQALGNFEGTMRGAFNGARG